MTQEELDTLVTEQIAEILAEKANKDTRKNSLRQLNITPVRLGTKYTVELTSEKLMSTNKIF